MPMAPAKPLQLIWAAVNRLTAEGQVAGPQHRVSLDTALKAMPIEAAYSIQQEKDIGSIEVGKQANLTILMKSPYEVPPGELKNITVWGTMLEGRIQPAPSVSASLVEPAGNSSPPGNNPAHDELAVAAATAHDHDHADGLCCACAMNRALSHAMAGVDRHQFPK
jgi:hypothetical protein